jgi:SAM-dependent methyltransferase
MEPYAVYGRFYDATQRTHLVRHYSHLLRNYHPTAKSLLEIACGTAANLVPLSNRYDVAGLDISATMLRIARQKLPECKFYKRDMAGFRLDRTFDAIICSYDSINHLLKFRDWVRTFRAAHRTLNEGGVFIFDMNTAYKLRQLAKVSPWVRAFDGNFLIMRVIDRGRGVCDWDTTIFERTRKTTYRRHREIVKEASFPQERVRSALKHEFARVRVLDAEKWGRPRKTSERLFFVCAKMRS